MVDDQSVRALCALKFSWQAPTDWAQIEADWLALSAQAHPNIFLTWTWVSTWAKVYDRVTHVLRVFDGRTLVAMGLWAHQFHRRPLGLNVRTLHLHHCGDEAYDQIWPEYNELLCAPGYRVPVHAALLSNLPTQPRITEVDLGVCEARLSKLLVAPSLSPTLSKLPGAGDGDTPAPWLREQRWSSNAINVPLSHWADFDAYLASLSSSFRYQLRRAEKGLKALGELRLCFAETAEQCTEWLLEDGVWHQQQWGADSGFNNPAFVRFHKAWIARGFAASFCGYCRLMAGDTSVAGAYFFRDHQTVYFYLGFARNEWGPKVKTGFCLHLAMIRYCFDQNIAVYDFMGGDYDYKRRFGAPGMTLVKCRYKPRTLLNQGEQVLKQLRARCKTVPGMREFPPPQ